MSGLYEVVGNKLTMRMHPGQLRAWDSERRFVGVVAGTQSGKTSWTGCWLWREIHRCGPGDYGFICPTFTLMELKALPEFRKFFEHTLRLGEYKATPVRRFTFSKDGAKRIFSQYTEAPDVPTQVFFGYADSPDSLESSTFKAAVLDEAGQKAFKRESWEAIQRRLAIHSGRALITTTPYFSGGWLRTEIYDRFRNGDPDVDFINFPSIMNPAFPREEFERAQATLPRWKFDLFYQGLFAKPAGLIYDCFEEERHTVQRFPIPSDWRRYVGMDFGGVNTAAVFFAEDPATRRLYAYREYKPAVHAGFRTAASHVPMLLLGEPGIPTAVGGSMSEDRWRYEYQRAGLPIRGPATPDVEIGIGRVYAAIKAGEVLFFDDLRGVLDEFSTYSRELDANGEVTDKIADKETFHRMDCIRYLLGFLKDGRNNQTRGPTAVGGRLGGMPGGMRR